MKHITILEEIFKSLQDLSTITGLDLILDDKGEFVEGETGHFEYKGPSRFMSIQTNRQTKIEIRQEEKHFVACLLRDNLVNYQQQIDGFYQELFDYLNRSQPGMKSAIFEMVYEKINSFRFNVPHYANSDYFKLEQDVNLLTSKGELTPGFDVTAIYEILTKRREIEREQILNSIEERVNSLQFSIEGVKNSDTESQNKKICLLHELGILKVVFERCKGDTVVLK